MYLTRREKETLVGLAEGLSYKEIGRKIGVAPKTVQTHARQLYMRLDAINAAHAVAIGFKAGVLQVQPLAKAA